MPSPDEGLVGATRERFNTLTAATGDRLRDKLLRPVEPIATGAKLAGRAEVPRPGQFRPGLSGQAPILSNTSRKIARFLDAGVPGLGRTLETVGQFAGKAAGGATLPATFGYLASGGQVEGALAGALVSAPFTSVGAGFGMFENYRTKADLYQRKIGDLQYYREHLSADEKVSFDALPLTDRLAMSGFSLSHPDIIFQGLSPEEMKGIGNYEGDTRTIQFNKDTGEGIVQGVIGHEIGHHIAIHGLRPMINKIMFGDSVTGEVGVYGYTDKDGNIVPNDEFVALKNAYQKVLDQDPTITQADKDRYLANEAIAEEIFADNVSDYLGAGRREKDNSWRGKIMDQVFESITGPGFLRDLILKLNVPMDSKGKFLEAGFFQGQGIKVERNVALQNLIKKYYRDTRGLRQREIEGEKVIDPASGRELKKLSKTGVRPVDPEWSESFSWDDMKDPKLVQKLNTGGLFKYQVDKNGKPILDEEGNPKVERDLLGNPKKFTLGELKKLSRQQGDFAIKVLEKYGVKIDQAKDGTPVARDFSNLDPRAIDELAEGPWHPRQIITLREIALALREGDGERAGFLLGYFAASRNRKPGPVPFKIRKAVPYGFELTQDGNFLVRLHDVAQLEKNLEFLKGGHKKLPAKYREEYQTLFEGDDNQVWSDFAQYRRNTIEGRDGSDGLSEKSDIATRKKNFLNALHGAINDEHVQLNPILRAIEEAIPGLPNSNKARSPFGAATKTFRLDRIFQTERTGHQSSRVNVDRVGKMLMPGGRPKKPGREKRVTARFSDDLAERVKAVAAQKGISQNDALVELIEQGLDVPEVTPEQAQPIPPKETTQPVESVDPSPDVLTKAEQEILQNPNSSAEYIAAKKKQDEIELQAVEDNVLIKGTKKVLHFLMKKDDGRRFMPSVDQRKATKYGQVFKQAGLNDIELAKAARTKWKEMGDSSPFVQRFLSAETDDAPAFAQIKNGEWKPIELYHVGPLGVASGKSRNPLEIFNDSPTVKNSESWTPESTTVLVLDRKKAYDLQRAGDPDQKPLQVITNAKYIFDVKNPEHVKTLDEQLAATARDEGVDPSLQEFSPTDPSSLFAYETELKKRGWHGYRFEEGGVEQIAIFDSKRIKLNQDQRGEGKFYSKDRDFGKVSGLFGHRLATDRFSANPRAEKDIRFMPQMEFDFTPPKSKKPKGETRPNWWQVYKINPKDPNVYDLVADEIIWRGSPEHDGAIAEQYSTFLNLDVRKLRPALTRAHRRWDRGDRRFMPAQDEQVQELKDQLEMLGPDPMYRDYPELAKAMENVENFLTPDERIEYFGFKVADRRARQEFERTFGVDPVIKPASARTLARQAGQYQVYDNWKRFIHDPMNKMEDASAARRRFRTGEAGKQFMPAAYHGTPHTFQPEEGAPLGKFKSAQIGTGEGAQAYGHGLYFASRKGVAEHYRSELVDKRNRLSPLKYDGQELDNKNPRHYAASNLVRAMPYGTKPSDVVAKDLEPFRKKEISRIEGEVAKLESGYQYGGLRPEMAHLNDLNFMKEVLSALKTKNEAKLSLEEGEGSLYKVELAPKENEYLLWDKPVPERFVDKIVKKSVEEGLVSDRKTAIEAIESNGADRQGSIFYRELSDQVGGDVAASQFLKEAGIPGIKYLDGSSRAKGKGDYNYVLFDEGDVTITEKMFMPASEAKNPKAGDMLTLDESSLKLFMPSPGNPNASLKDFNGKFVQVLTSDLSVVGDKKSDGVMISFQGGPGYLSVNDAWGFTNQGGAKGFQTRWERAGRPLVGITSMKQENHRASTLTREYYVRKFMEAINDGKIAESTVNRHIRAALKRAIDGKNGLTNDQKSALKTVKTIEDFLRVFPDKELIPWKATPMIYEKLDLKGLPIKQDRLKKLGLDTGTILRETRQPEYNDIKKGSLLAIAEYDGSDAVYRPDLNSAYPWSIPLKEKAFLKDFADIQDLSSRAELRGPDGEANMAVAMGAGVMLDRLGRREVNFMPSDPKAPKRQPVNRVQPQAPSMPANRFMAPAVTTGGKLSERFR